MKWRITIAILLTMIIGFAGVKYAVDNTTEPVAVSEPKSKYEIGPPTPQEMLELINMEREKVGVAPLTLDDSLMASAQLKANDMHEHDYFSHNIPYGEYKGKMYTKSMEDLIYPICSRSGENIRRNASQANTSIEAHKGLRGSPPHYKAMIDPKNTKLGVGVAGYKVVQHFCVAK